jgi:Flp pilus assembly pilin Flp
VSARGQASTEYVVVLAFCVITLIVLAQDPSPVRQLVEAIKDYFAAYSYAISLTP